MAQRGREDTVCPYCCQVVDLDREGRMVKHKSGGLAAAGSYPGVSSDVCNGSGREVEPA